MKLNIEHCHFTREAEIAQNNPPANEMVEMEAAGQAVADPIDLGEGQNAWPMKEESWNADIVSR